MREINKLINQINEWYDDDYDNIDASIEVTAYFNIKEYFKTMLAEGDIDDANNIKALIPDIIRYFGLVCQKLNKSGIKYISFTKNNVLYFTTSIPYRSVRSAEKFEEVPEELYEELYEILEKYFLKSFYVSVPKNSRLRTSREDNYHVGDVLRSRKGKINILPILQRMVNDAESYRVELEWNYKEDLDDLVHDHRDYIRSREEAADAYFHR